MPPPGMEPSLWDEVVVGGMPSEEEPSPATEKRFSIWQAKLSQCAKDNLTTMRAGGFIVSWTFEGTDPQPDECTPESTGIVIGPGGSATFSASCLEGVEDVGDLDGNGHRDLLIVHVDCAYGPMDTLGLDVYAGGPKAPKTMPLPPIPGDVSAADGVLYKGQSGLQIATVADAARSDDLPETRTLVMWERGELTVVASQTDEP